jgi:protein phosphatase
MGTTMTLVRLHDDRLLVAHVGDSRGYLLHDAALVRITRDHTFVQQLVDEGSLAPDEVAHHPARSVLTQALDGGLRAHADISTHPVVVGDRVLLCSDGLSGVVAADRIADLLGEADVATAADALIAAALAGGAPDNVTVVLAEVVEAAVDPAADTTDTASTLPTSVALWLGAAAPRQATPDIPPGLGEGTPVDGADSTEETARSADRHSGMALFGAVLMAIGALGTLLAVAHVWASSQWYVAEIDGRAAIIRGLPQPLLGLPTGGPVEISEVRVVNLPATEAQRLADGIAADDETDAADILQRIRQAEAACIGSDPEPGCPG